MRFLRYYFLVLVLGITSNTWSAIAVYHPPSSTIPQEALEFTFEFLHEVSQGTFDQDGHFKRFIEQQNYQRFEYRGIIRYGISDQLEWRGGLRYRENISTDPGGYHKTAAGPESVMLGLRYGFYRSPGYSLALDLEVRKLLARPVSSESPGESSDKVELSDEGEFFRLGSIITIPFSKQFSLSGDWGLVLPAKNQSVESNFDLALYWSKRRLAIGLGLDGIFSYRQDDFTHDPGQKPSKPIGQTDTINSINRSYQRGYAAIHLRLSRHLRGELRGGEVWGGKSWDRQLFGQFNLVYRQADEYGRVFKYFKQYHVEAQVLKISPRGQLLKIDRGFSSNVEKGMRFDIYQEDHLAESILVASGRVFAVRADTAVIKILKIFREDVKIEQGDIARGVR